MKVKTVDVRHAGGDRFVASTGSGHEMSFDSAAGDTALRPTEAVVAALAACAGIDVHSIAIKQRQDLVAYVIHVRAEQRDGHPDYFTRIDVVHEVTGPGLETAAIRRCIELSATRYCPVNAMLSAGPTEIHHRYRILRPDEPPEEGEALVSGPFQRPVVA